MATQTFSTDMPVPAAKLSDWHFAPGAFERLSPPWQDVTLVHQDRPIVDGSKAEVVLKKGPIRSRWLVRHTDVRPGHSFRDEQVSGPFAAWRHRHEFGPGEDVSSPAGSRVGEHRGGGTESRRTEDRPTESRLAESRLTDEVTYRLPLEPLSRWIAGGFVEGELRRLFRHRHELTRRDLERHSQFPDTKLRVAITGGTGLVGSQLAAYLSTAGHEVSLLERRGGSSGPPWAGSIEWSIREETIDAAALEGVDAVVHLAGAPIAVRWTDDAKRAIRDSRVNGTSFLARTLAGLDRPPKVVVSTSAVGFYGRGIDDQLRVESSPAGTGFLADVAQEWEAAADPLRERGIRVVHPRLGVVLSPKGGALAKMLPAFQFGAGGPIGSGRQWFPWISLEDVLGALEFAIHRDDLHGPVNFVAPECVRQAEFASVLGKVLRRPSFAPLPAFVVRTLFGGMADEALLSGVPVVPQSLEESGFTFQHRSLEAALRDELGRWTD